MHTDSIAVGTGANKREVKAPWRVPESVGDLLTLLGAKSFDALESKQLKYLCSCFDRGSRIRAQDGIGRAMRKNGATIAAVYDAMVSYEHNRVTTKRVRVKRAPPTIVIREGMTAEDFAAEAARAGILVVQGK